MIYKGKKYRIVQSNWNLKNHDRVLLRDNRLTEIGRNNFGKTPVEACKLTRCPIQHKFYRPIKEIRHENRIWNTL